MMSTATWPSARLPARDVARDPAHRDAIQRTLAEAAPMVDGGLRPPCYEEDDGAELFGVSIEETRAFSAKALERRLKVVGLA